MKTESTLILTEDQRQEFADIMRRAGLGNSWSLVFYPKGTRGYASRAWNKDALVPVSPAYPQQTVRIYIGAGDSSSAQQGEYCIARAIPTTSGESVVRRESISQAMEFIRDYIVSRVKDLDPAPAEAEEPADVVICNLKTQLATLASEVERLTGIIRQIGAKASEALLA